jgi:tape measure domain-containing protein
MANGGDITYIINVNGSGAVNGANQVSRAFGNLQQIGTKLMGMGAGLTAAFTLPLVAAAKAGLSFDSAMEQANTNFGTLLGSAQKAKTMVSDLQKFANETPFEMKGLTDSAQMLLSFGVSANDVMPTIKMLGDASLGNQEKFRGLSLAYSQMAATGRLMGQDLLQMINAGFNPLQIISEKTGISMKDLKKRMEDGAISADMVKKAFQIATSEGGRYYKAMDNASKTFEGRMSTLKDAVKSTLGAVMKPIFEELSQKILPALIDKVGKLQEWFQNLSPTMQKIIAIAGLIIASIGPLLLIIGGLITTFSTIAGAISAIGAPVIIVIAAIAALVGAIVYLWNTSEKFRNVVAVVWDWIATKIETVINYIGNLWNQYGVVIIEAMILAWQSLVAFIQPILDYFAKLFYELWQNLQPVFDSIGELFKALGSLFMSLWDLVQPIVKQLGVILWVLLGVVVAVFGGLVKSLAPALKFMVDGLTSLVYVLKAAAQALSGDFSGAWDSLKKVGASVGNMWTDMGDTVTAAIEGIKGGTQAYADGTVAAIDKISNGMGKLKEDWAKATSGKLQTPGEFTGVSALTFKPITLPRIDDSEHKKSVKDVGEASNELNSKMRNTKDLVDGLKADFSNLGDTGSKAGKDIADKFKDVAKSIKDQTNSFANFIGLFDRVQRSGTGSGESLANRLRKQVEEMKKWSEALTMIKGKLGPGNEDLMDELRKLGPGNARQIIGLSRLDSKQLKEYASLYGQKQGIAWQQAKQVVKYEHTGTIIVRGVNQAGETKEIANIVAADLAANKDRYGKNPSANKAFK